MRTLIISRHGEKDETIRGGSDVVGLTSRGFQQCANIGKSLKQIGLKPDFILCSGALRTRQSLTELLNHANFTSPQPETLFHEYALLDALNPIDLNEILSSLIPETSHISLVMGHNPGLNSFTEMLIKSSQPHLQQHLMHGYPTAMMCVFNTSCDDFYNMSEQNSELIHVIKNTGEVFSKTLE